MTSSISARFEPEAGSKYPIPEGLRADCGYLTVPESRSAASGYYPSDRTLRLYVTRVRSLSEHPAPEPVVVLYGGPGGMSAGILRGLAQPHARDLFLKDRDLIVFDQRGSGFSEPALFAPEAEPLIEEAFLTEFDAAERAAHYVQTVLRARDRFVARGANLAAINTPEIAADLDDLRRALGYERVNLYSISYGTRIALAAMRDFPHGLRSAVLDSTVPIQVSQYVEAIPNARYAFERLFSAVAADAEANARYPQLKAVFSEVVARLNRAPVLLPCAHPATGEAIQMRVTGEVFIGICCNDFYSAPAIAAMPERIYAAYRGEYDSLGKELLQLIEAEESAPGLPGWSLGMYHSVNLCDDKVTRDTAAEIAHHAAQDPEMSSLALTEFHLGEHVADLAEPWGARPAGPAEYRAAASDAPALILAGEFDQNTPAFWGKLAGETLTNSYYVEYPGSGHGVIGMGPLAADLMRAFYERPMERPNDAAIRAVRTVFVPQPDEDA